jgi:hypothetical protein
LNSISIEVVVPINIAHAWEYYFNQVNSWWSKEHYSSPKTKRFIIETFIGGRVYEDFGEGDGLVWGTVIGANYLHSIDILGYLTRSFGGPAISYEKYSFDADGQNTKLTYTMDIVGAVPESTVKSLKEGWEDIIQQKYYQYCINMKN